jgi:hypothetical protein
VRVREYAAASTGSLILLGTLVEAFRGSWGLYENYYRLPKEKYGVLSPLRWQDVVFIASFYVALFLLGYLSFRLLKYSFRHRGRGVA